MMPPRSRLTRLLLNATILLSLSQALPALVSAVDVAANAGVPAPGVAGPDSISPSAFSCDSVTEIPTTECEALVTFYNSTEGYSTWTRDGWLQTSMPCTWEGVSCTSGHVTSLEFGECGLEGSIPYQLADLSKLTVLRLTENFHLTGQIPPQLGSLHQLVTLDLAENSLEGEIPPELGNLSELEDLFLDYNHLEGSIPPELGNLSHLRILFLADNELSGTIPSELANPTELVSVQASSNHLTGPIPAEFGRLSKLKYLNLAGNRLSGGIPQEIGNLRDLKELLLGGNPLSGTIPPTLGNLVDLEVPWLILHTADRPDPAGVRQIHQSRNSVHSRHSTYRIHPEGTR